MDAALFCYFPLHRDEVARDLHMPRTVNTRDFFLSRTSFLPILFFFDQVLQILLCIFVLFFYLNKRLE